MTTESSAPDPAHLIPATGRLRRSRRLWRIVAILALAVAVLAALGRFAAPTGAPVDHIARVVIDGTIATSPERLRIFHDLAEDERVKAVVVAINSPGGTTAGGEELYEALAEVRARKPVVAVIAELGASAAYMTAIGADRIFARRLSIVGSIGVLYQHVDAGKLLQTIGIDLDKVATGPLKAEPDIDGPIRPEVRQSIQSLVDDSFAWFVDVVAERRGLDRARVLALADGRIVTGRQGVELGLIDATGGEAEAIDWLESERDIAAELPVWTAWPLPDTGYGWVLDWVGGSARAALGLEGRGPIVLDGLVSLWQVDRVP